MIKTIKEIIETNLLWELRFGWNVATPPQIQVTVNVENARKQFNIERVVLEEIRKDERRTKKHKG